MTNLALLPGTLPALRAPDRSPPCNVPAEKALLGAVMVNRRAWETVASHLKPRHFAIPQHALIYEAMGKLFDSGTVADPVTLRRFFETERALTEIGGPEYLIELAESATTVINAGEYGRLIRDLALRRDLIALCEQTLSRAYEGDVAVRAVDLRSQLEAGMFEAFAGALETAGGRLIDAHAEDALRDAEEAWKRGGAGGLSTGLADLDGALGGLFPGDLVVAAGRPGMGKSALAFGMARAAARGGVPALVFSLEMPGSQLALREIAAEANVTVADVRAGRIDADGFDRMMKAAHGLKKVPVYIMGVPRIDMSAIAAECARVKRAKPLGLIVVDYLQLIDADGRGDNRIQEITYITRRLKALALEMSCPVIALSQLNRSVESRDDKKPHLADLRESGSIEQDADSVLLLYRRAYYLANEEPRIKPGESPVDFDVRHQDWVGKLEASETDAEIIVAKNRHGRTGSVHVHWNGAAMRFGDRYRGESRPSATDNQNTLL